MSIANQRPVISCQAREFPSGSFVHLQPHLLNTAEDRNMCRSEDFVTSSLVLAQEPRTTTGLTIQRTASGMPVVNKQYLLVKRLGEGSFGTVRLVLNLQDMGLYAIKFISKKHLRTSVR